MIFNPECELLLIQLLNLLPIDIDPKENLKFGAPACHEVITATLDYYNRTGFIKPWIGYFANEKNTWVGMGGFKGQPKAGKVEIAYGTFPEFEGQGFGTKICKELVQIALRTDSALRITARTLPERSGSTTILERNNFVCRGSIWDDDDGTVWEWEYQSRQL